LNLDLQCKKIRKRQFLAEMERVVPWAALVELITPYYPQGLNGRPPFALETMLRVHFMQQWFSLSDPAMEEAFFDVPLYREFAQLEAFGRLPDESTILRFRHRLEEHKLAEQILRVVNDILLQRGLLLKTGTVVDAMTGQFAMRKSARHLRPVVFPERCAGAVAQARRGCRKKQTAIPARRCTRPGSSDQAR
jgi:IS5 family transposase